jgi:chromosome partitioning protein
VAKVISFINYKGGVGKTTTTYHVGCALAYLHAKRVLLIDIDPQCNLTLLCATYDRWTKYTTQGGASIVTLFDKYLAGKGTAAGSSIWKSPVQDGVTNPTIPLLDLIPSDMRLLVDPDVRVSRDLRAQKGSLASQISAVQAKAETYVLPRIFLRTLLLGLQDQYDYILVDCPPNLYLLTQNALLASDAYVVTALPDHLSTIGISLLTQGTQQIATTVGQYAGIIGKKISTPKFGGIVFVRVLRQQPTRIHAETMDRVRTAHPNMVFSDYTTELTGYQEASEAALPVFLRSGANAKRAAGQYIAITQEFLRRFP